MTSRSVVMDAVVALLSFSASFAQGACGADFCTVNTNWDVQGLTIERGLRLDLRFEYIKQDQPKSEFIGMVRARARARGEAAGSQRLAIA
jgi:hypothetical protein